MKYQQKNNSYAALWLLVFWVAGSYVYSQNSATNNIHSKTPSGRQKFITSPFENKVFIEEQGQFKKTTEQFNITIPDTILYAVNNAEFNAYFTRKGITFLFSKMEKPHREENEEREDEKEERPLIKWEALNMEWINPLPSMKITVLNKVNDYYTFREYADNKQYDHVSAYKKLYYSNIYEGVDAEFELPEQGGIKYQFIVRAGHTIPAIAYKISNTKNLYIDTDGNLHIQAEFNDLIDKAPIASTKSTIVPVKYSLKENIIELNFETQSPFSEDLIIDPWIINPALPSPNIACDIQEDSVGNIYINGGTSGSGSYQVQKYNSTGVLQWSHNYSCSYYGDIAVANSGSIYYSDGISGKVTKLSSTGSVIYSITEGSENWRFSFNKSKTILAMGGNFGASSLTNIDTTNGAFTNTVSYPSDTWAIATDCNGDIYSLHQGASPCILRKTDANFNPVSSLVTSPDFCVTGYSNVRAYASGYNAITISGPYLYIYDGLQLRRFLKNTLTFVNSVSVPNGTANNCSGIAFDYCGNIYVGTMSTIEKYDNLLNPISSIPAPNIVYDIILAGNGDLLACGKSFVANFGPTCPYPPPLVVTATSTNVSCNPGTATIIATGGTLPYAYLWQPGGQTTATATGLTPGTYSYRIDDSFCQSHEDSVVVVQTSPLSLSLGIVNKENCLNSFDGSATVSASGGTGPYSYSWNTNPVQNTQTATGLGAGVYLATVTDADSCQDTLSVVIVREPVPVANFGSTKVCNDFPTMFTDSSVVAAGTITSWSWNFGDTTAINTNQNPSHIYTYPGTHNATLIINTSLGCADTIIKTVTVHYNPVSDFTHNDVCMGDTMYFTSTSSVDSSASIVSYMWFFGESSASSTLQNTSHLYSFPGTYTVTLIVTTNNGCKDTVTKNVVVHPLPVPLFTTANVCYGYYASFNESSSITNTDTIQSWRWNFDDASPLLYQQQVTGGHLYTAPATYNVQLHLTSTFGCADSVTHPVIIYPKPVAGFTAINKCDGTDVPFTDSSTTASGSTINAWNWNFGDGSPAGSTQNLSHLYANAGNYSATLIVQNNFACADTITKPITVYFNPVANFNVQDVCFKDSVFFYDSSYVDVSASVASWLWVFNDGSPTSSLQNPVHYYSSFDTYGVTLLATTNQGCSNAANINVNVFDPPVADFNIANICLVDSALFNNTSDNPSMGTIASWTWNFGDATPLNTTDLNPLHLYADTGTYTITLISRSSNLACADTASDSIVVFPMPVAGFTAADVCLGQNMGFNDSSLVASGTVDTWSWEFGDNGALSALQNPVHPYAAFDGYTVTLIATTNHNCKDTTSSTVVVHPLPDANFTFNNVCLGNTMVLNDLSLIPANISNDVISFWNWDFGDNSAMVNSQNTTHLYAAVGTDSVELKVVSSFGCADSVTRAVTINPNPSVSFTTSDTAGCEPLCIDFSNSSIIASGNNSSWIWNFGDGNTTANNTLINHCFFNDSVFNPKIYTISLTVTSDSGCVTSLTKTNLITVFPKPDAGFSVIPTSASIINPVIAITDLSTGANFWFWNFGDGSAPLTIDIDSSSIPIQHTYADTGTYTITLITTTQYNCIDTAFQTVFIEPDIAFFIPTAFSPNDDGVNDTFIGRGIFINTFEMSIFDRWGNLIYRTDDMNKPWNGKANYGNEPAQPDVYIYSIKITDLKLKKYNYKGTVTLIK